MAGAISDRSGPKLGSPHLGKITHFVPTNVGYFFAFFGHIFWHKKGTVLARFRHEKRASFEGDKRGNFCATKSPLFKPGIKTKCGSNLYVIPTACNI